MPGAGPAPWHVPLVLLAAARTECRLVLAAISKTLITVLHLLRGLRVTDRKQMGYNFNHNRLYEFHRWQSHCPGLFELPFPL